MTHRHRLRIEDRTIGNLCRSTLLFDWIVMLCSRYFCQILSVLREANRSQKLFPCHKRYQLYQLLKILASSIKHPSSSSLSRLSSNTKCSLIPYFLLKLWDGKLPFERNQPIQLPPSIKIIKDKEEMTHGVFPKLCSNFHEEEWIVQQAIMTTCNEHLYQLNRFTGSTILGPHLEFYSADAVDEAEANDLNYPFELLNSIASAALQLDHILSLKNGYFFMLLLNLQPNKVHRHRFTIHRRIHDRQFPLPMNCTWKKQK